MTDSFDQVVGSFQRMGLSESAARLAATRGSSEADARAAWAAGDAAALAAQMRESATLKTSPIVAQTAAAAHTHLSMNEAEAGQFAVRLYERENARAGSLHAETYLRTFCAGLQHGRRVTV